MVVTLSRGRLGLLSSPSSHRYLCRELPAQFQRKEPLEPMGFPRPGLVVELVFKPGPRPAFSRLFKQLVLPWGDHHPLLLLTLCTEAR